MVFERLSWHVTYLTHASFRVSVSKQYPCFTAVEDDGGDKRHVQLKLACKSDGVAPPDPQAMSELLYQFFQIFVVVVSFYRAQEN